MVQTAAPPAPIPPPPPRNTALATVRAWYREQIKGKTSFNLTELADQAATAFLVDEDFMRRLFKEYTGPAFYEVAGDVVNATRGRAFLIGDQVLSLEEKVARAKKESTKFIDWMEHSGQRHIKLEEMTKADLLQAAEERYARGRREFHFANLWVNLANQLDDGQRVKDRFSPEVIAQIEIEMQQS